MSSEEIRALEHVGYGIWVASDVEELDGWHLRHAGGLTSRANSVFPNEAGAMPLGERLERVESWYRHRGLPARYQLTDASLPLGLDDALRARGYEQPSTPVGVHVARLDDAVVDPRVQLADEPDEAWIALWAGSRGGRDLATARALLTGSQGRAVFASIEGVAVGRAVANGEWLGITSMLTAPDARRQGLGRAILSALIGWGCEAGATRGFLQTDNPAAQALYAQFGFEQRYAYHYLVEPS